MFRLLGVALAVYVAWAVLQGRVHAKRRAWGETIARDAAPERFWTVIVIYSALSAALVFVF
jgi:hypothetical protein